MSMQCRARGGCWWKQAFCKKRAARLSNASDDIREDAILGGRLHLRQWARGHRAGTDAVLLAAAAPAGRTIIDAGSGVGTAGLIVALRQPQARLLLVERDDGTARLAQENIVLNDLGDRASVTIADLLSPPARRVAGLADNSADVLISNPPFYAASEVRASPDNRRADAHVGAAGFIDNWTKAFAALVAGQGRLAMIHRPDALPDILAACEGRFGALAVLPVHPRAAEPAVRILVGGVKGSRAPLRLLPGLVLHGSDGRFTPEAEAIHRGEAFLDLYA